jgi:Na+-transporting NADH:ubiquinone oxidoreductase subunit NqrB
MTREQWVLVAYAVLHLQPFAWAAVTWSDFWHSVAPFSTLFVLAALLALVWRRRWAWRLLIVINALALLSYIRDPAEDPVGVLMAVVRLALLLSPAMQRYLAARPPGGLAVESQ